MSKDKPVVIPYGMSDIFCKLARKHLGVDTVVEYGCDDDPDTYRVVLKLCQKGRQYGFDYNCSPYAGREQLNKCKAGECDHDKWDIISESEPFTI